MTYDAVIVLGTGISQDGTLPESCLSNVRAAIKLYQEKQVSKLIFAGKWAWNCKFTPPMTEGQAMSDFAQKNNISKKDIFIEDKTVTTLSNLCKVKENILMPNNFFNVALICSSDVVKERNEYNLKMILGPEYTYDIVMSETDYPKKIYQELKTVEIKKMANCLKFYEGVIPGNHQEIFELAMTDLQKNYINKKLSK